MKHMIQFSGGKDSTAMLKKMIELQWDIDEVVFFDTGWEFNAIYQSIEDMRLYLKKIGIKFTILKPDKSFDYLAFEKEVHKRNGTIQKGYGWCGGACRWGTSAKTDAINRYVGKRGQAYIGIAADEQELRPLRYTMALDISRLEEGIIPGK